jgi:Transcriptional regulator, AbiEi antitoxin
MLRRMDLLPFVADSRLPAARPFTTAEAREAGVSAEALRRLCRQGQLRHVLRGVYVDATVRDDLLTRSIALSLVVADTAVVTDETAGWLHGAAVLPPGQHLHLPPVKVFQLPGNTRVRRRGVHGGERSFVARDLQTVHGVLTTTPLRTALDLGRLTPRDRALGSMDSLMRVGDFDRDDLLRETSRFKGFRGVIQLRALAPLVDPRSESPGESALRLRWLDAGLPAPELQVPVVDEVGLTRFYGDLGLPALRFLAEYDGADFHTTPSDTSYDEQRRSWLRAHGWVVVVLTRREVFTHPQRAADLLRRGHAEARMRARHTAA